MDDMTAVALAMAGIALVVAASWQFAGRQPFDAIHFVARLVASFVAIVVLAALLYGLAFVIGLSNVGGGASDLGISLRTFGWLSVGIAFVIAISPAKTESRSCSASSQDGSSRGSASSASASC